MKLFAYLFVSIAVTVALSFAYALLLASAAPLNPITFVTWLLCTLIEGFLVTVIAGGLYFIPAPDHDYITYQIFVVNYESDEEITEELEAIHL